jgi:hypothetical protein
MHNKYKIAAIVSLLLGASSGLWFAKITLTTYAIDQETFHAIAEPSKRTSTHERPQCLFLC